MKNLYTVFFAITILAMVAYLYKTHKRWLLTVLVRAAASVLAILLLNVIFSGLGLSLMVGINPVSLVSCGLLGVPGLILLYGATYFFLKY